MAEIEEGQEELTRTRDYNLTDIGILLKVVIKLLQRQTKILEDAWMNDGTTMTNNFTIPRGSHVVKIDFVEGKHAYLPNNFNPEVPYVPVQQLKLNNLGPGIIAYSTNKFLNQYEAADTLIPGETIKIETPKRSIRQINLAANEDACKVRLGVIM